MNAAFYTSPKRKRGRVAGRLSVAHAQQKIGALRHAPSLTLRVSVEESTLFAIYVESKRHLS